MASLMAQRIKHLPAMQGTWVRSLGWEDPLEEEMAAHSCSCLENRMGSQGQTWLKRLSVHSAMARVPWQRDGGRMHWAHGRERAWCGGRGRPQGRTRVSRSPLLAGGSRPSLSTPRLWAPPTSPPLSPSLLKLRSIESVMISSHLILCCPLLLPSVFPNINIFSLLFASGGQSIGASASVLPVDVQGWFPLGLTGLIFLQSQELWRVFSSTTIQKN